MGTGGRSPRDLHPRGPSQGPGSQDAERHTQCPVSPGPSMSASAGRRPRPRAAHQAGSTKTPLHPSDRPRWPGHSLNMASGRQTRALRWGPRAGQVLPAGGQCAVPASAWKCRLQSSRQPRSQKLHPRGSPRSHPREATEPTLTASGQKMSHVTNHGPPGACFLLKIQPGGGAMDEPQPSHQRRQAGGL